MTLSPQRLAPNLVSPQQLCQEGSVTQGGAVVTGTRDPRWAWELVDVAPGASPGSQVVRVFRPASVHPQVDPQAVPGAGGLAGKNADPAALQSSRSGWGKRHI